MVSFFDILFCSFTFWNTVSTKTVSILPVKTPKLCMLIAQETHVEFMRGIRVLSIVCINPSLRKLWVVLGMVPQESGIQQPANVNTSWRVILMPYPFWVSPMALLLQDPKTNHSDYGSRVNKRRRSKTRMKISLDLSKKSLESDLHRAQMTKQSNYGPQMVISCKLSKAIKDSCLLSRHYQVVRLFQEVTIAP